VAQTATRAAHGSFWLVVLAACSGAFAVAYNTTAVMTVLPAMKTNLDLGTDTLEWVINLYMLTCAVSLVAIGHAADSFGMVRVFVIGLMAFALGSIAIALADDAALVLGGRVLQGLGVAGVLSTSVAMINIATPEDRRSAALGLWAAAVAIGFALGPSIGGALADWISWRAIFVFDLAILGAAGLLCLLVVRARLVPHALDAGTRIDTIGIAALTLALGTFLYGLTSGQLTGWTSPQTLPLLAVAVLAGAAFVVRERWANAPLVDLGFFAHADYVAATLGMIVNGSAQIGVLYFFNLFLQAPEGFGFSPAQAGLALLPFTMAMLAVSLTAPRLLPPKLLGWALTSGMLALAAGFWLMHDIGRQTPYGEIWWRLAIVGVGVGLAWSLLPRVGLRGLPDANAGQGSGVITTCNFIGLATGTAAGGVLASYIKHSYVDPVIERLPSQVADLDSLKITMVHGPESAIARVMGNLPPDDATVLKEAMRTGFGSAFSGVMVMMAVVGLFGAGLCFALIRRPTAG